MSVQDETGQIVQGNPGRISRRAFLGLAGMSVAALAASSSPLGALGARVAKGPQPSAAVGYGPLMPKGDLALPAEFNYQIISMQGVPQRDGTPTPSIFDAMGAFPDAGGRQNSTEDTTAEDTGATNPPGDTTILIRNHENRRQRGEIPVEIPPELRYDDDLSYTGGYTKLLIRKNRRPGTDGSTDTDAYELVDSFNMLGGTDTNCAGGELPFKKWITCEEVVNRGASGKQHGYNFEVDAMSDGPVQARPILAAGCFVHEATTFRGGIFYQTEDRRIQTDPVSGQIGACLYRYASDQRVGQSDNLADTTGPLEALAIEGSPAYEHGHGGRAGGEVPRRVGAGA